MKLGMVLALAALLLVLAKQGKAQEVGGVYQCLGGCFNKCILLAGADATVEVSCYLACSSACLVPQGATTEYYCQLGCSFFQCSNLAYDGDGAQLETCLKDCNDSNCGKIA